MQSTYSQSIIIDEYKNIISLKDFHLHGKVKNITSTARDNNGLYATLPFYENVLYNQVSLDFNKNGLLERKTNFLDYQGNLGIYSFIEYTYKNSNLLINEKKTIINNGEDSKRIASNKDFFYKNNILIRLVENLKSKSSIISNYETIFEYTNKLNKIITKIEGKITSENRLVYNKKGFVVLNELISFDGKTENKTFFIYDKDVPVIEQKFVGNLNTITFFERNEISKIQSFDSNKNLKYEAIFNSKNEIQSFKNQYFRNGKTLLSNYRVEYTYDKVGNWISANIFTDSNLEFVVNRKIEYYDNVSN